VTTPAASGRFHASGYNGCIMPKKKRTKKITHRPQPGSKWSKKLNTKYSAGEIAMAILGAAILVMVAGIIITSLIK
jgi:hypothetical protein